MADLAVSTPEEEQLLIDTAPELIQHIKLSPLFWALLVKYNVLQETDVTGINKVGIPDTQKISELVDHIRKGPRGWYHSFIQTLCETNQTFIVSDILKASSKYSGPKGNVLQNELIEEKQQLLSQKKAALQKYIEVSDKFWKSLIQKKALSVFEEQIFQESTSKEKQIHDLIEFLKTGTNRTYLGFLNALSETGQGHIVTDILGENISQDLFYRDEFTDTLLTKDQKKELDQKAPALINNVIPSELLWASLVKRGVISDTESRDIVSGEKANTAQIQQLLSYIKTTARYEGFVCALIEDRQFHVVTGVLEEDVDTYKKKYSLQSIHTGHGRLHDAIGDIKRSIIEKENQTSVPDLSRNSQNIKLENIYTLLAITKNDGKDKESSNSVTEETMLDTTANVKVQALCVGEAGCGKTTLAKRLAWLWAKDKHSHYFWSTIKVVLFLTSTYEGDTLDVSLRNSMPGKKANKDVIMELFHEEPESVLVIVEAFDDFQNHEVKKEIKQLVRDKAANIFLTMRKDSPLINEEFESLFNQHYDVKGFTRQHSEEYTSKLLKEMGCRYDIGKFLNAIAGTPKIHTHPLNLLLASQLYSEGELNPNDIDTLTEVNLYSMRAARMVEREIERQQKTQYDSSTEVTKIKKLAFISAIKGSPICHQSDLTYLGIEQDSPAMILLEKHEPFTAKHGREVYWTWPHSRLYEFDVAAALADMQPINRSIWLYWIANRPDLNPIAHLVVILLFNQNNVEEVKDLITSSILLQSDMPCRENQSCNRGNLHPCDWIRLVKKEVNNLSPQAYITNEKSKYADIIKDLPKLSAVSKCCGDLLMHNSSLYHHIQFCFGLKPQNGPAKEDIEKTFADLLSDDRLI